MAVGAALVLAVGALLGRAVAVAVGLALVLAVGAVLGRADIDAVGLALMTGLREGAVENAAVGMGMAVGPLVETTVGAALVCEQ